MIKPRLGGDSLQAQTQPVQPAQTQPAPARKPADPRPFAVLARKPADLQALAQEQDADGPMTDRALEIVRRFIIEKRLVVFGGLAIDYSLRLRGASLYSDSKRPDFDFLSSRSVDDAYELADRLAAAGFENVGVLRAIHIQTMRVRTAFVFVADVGYAPADVLDRIPTLEYRGMRVVHPDFQRIDMHLALSFPYEDAPREAVFHRWPKDVARFALFEKYYPYLSTDRKEPKLKLVTSRLAANLRGDTPPVALHGFAAYAALRELLHRLETDLKAPASAGPRLAIALTAGGGGSSVSVEVPAGDSLHIATPDPVEALAGQTLTWRDPYMDICPESAQAGNLIAYSTQGRLLAASTVDVGGCPARVVSPQYLMVFFLFQAHMADGPEREIYRSYYVHTLAMVRAAEKLYIEHGQKSTMGPFSLSPFGLVTSVIGTVNTSTAHILKISQYASAMHEDPPGISSAALEALKGLPSGYRPGRSSGRPKFDYAACAAFRRSMQIRS